MQRRTVKRITENTTTELQISREKRLKCAEKDYISSLPRDCLLSAFSFLDRAMLDELECVSQGFQNIVNNGSLMRIKKQGEKEGHGFEIKVCNENHRLRYFIGRNNIRRELPQKGERSRKGGQTRAVDVSDLIDGGRSTSVPIPLFDNVSEILMTCESSRIIFDSILVDNQFVKQCQRAFQGTQPIEFIFEGEVIDEKIDLKKFAKFLSDAKLSWLEFEPAVEPPSSFFKLFDEKFLTAFANAACTSRPPAIRLHCGYQSADFWVASKELLPIVCRYVDILLVTMKLEPAAVVELIQMRLAMTESDEVRWRFGLTGELKEEHLEKIDSTRFTKIVNNGPYLGIDDWEFKVKLITSNFQCKMCVLNYQNMHLMVTEFEVLKSAGEK